MKIIALHCDYIRFKALKKAIKEPEELDEKEKKGKEIKECLVVLSAVERNDEGFEEEISRKLVENIKGIAEQVNCKKIVLYPYVHLTSHPSAPISATKVLYITSETLKKEKFMLEMRQEEQEENQLEKQKYFLKARKNLLILKNSSMISQNQDLTEKN